MVCMHWTCVGATDQATAAHVPQIGLSNRWGSELSTGGYKTIKKNAHLTVKVSLIKWCFQKGIFIK